MVGSLNHECMSRLVVGGLAVDGLAVEELAVEELGFDVRLCVSGFASLWFDVDELAMPGIVRFWNTSIIT